MLMFNRFDYSILLVYIYIYIYIYICRGVILEFYYMVYGNFAIHNQLLGYIVCMCMLHFADMARTQATEHAAKKKATYGCDGQGAEKAPNESP